MAVPAYDDLFNPLLDAIRTLGGSASIPEQERTVAELLKLSDKDVSEIHRANQTKLGYRLAWARTYLKRYGLLQNSDRAVWSLTPVGLKTPRVAKEEVKRFIKELDRKEQRAAKDEQADAGHATWEDELLEVVRQIEPAAFERLCQRVLRESGFIQVVVTGRSGDGGIDGKGVVRLGGILSFHVLFQCKRYRGSVSPSVVRDFRGALVGRADKGVIITTGAFSKDARLEAQRDGAPPIDLIDGEELIQRLKDLRIGVDVTQRIVDEVIIRREYFEEL